MNNIVPQPQQPLAPQPAPIETAELLAAFYGKLTKRTLKTYKQGLARLCEFMGEPNAARALDKIIAGGHGNANLLALRWVQSMEAAGKSAKTIQVRLVALKGAIALAKMLGKVDWSLDVKGPKIETYRDLDGASEDTVQKIIAAAAQQPPIFAARDLAVLWLLYGQGMRCFEVTGLRWKDYDAEKSVLWILGKGHSQRQPVTLGPKAKDALDLWLSKRGGTPGPMFYSRKRDATGWPAGLTEEGVGGMLDKLCTRAGVETTPHGLRHAFANKAVDVMGGNILAVQEALRHSSPATTMIYLRRRQDLAGEVARKVQGGEK